MANMKAIHLRIDHKIACGRSGRVTTDYLDATWGERKLVTCKRCLVELAKMEVRGYGK